MEKLINFALRLVFGGVAILCINGLFLKMGTELVVGLNGITLTVSGFLGMPGVLALYALELYRHIVSV
ncbi:MAG: pro-sigmaK processing inhibitor BofA family protein [Acetatifactor sp.]